VGFVVADVHYALPVARVRQIVNPMEVAKLPRVPPPIVGVAEHRGQVLAVIDLRTHFAAEVTNDKRVKWILVDLGERVAALVVDGVTGVFGAPHGPDPAPVPGAVAGGVTRVAQHDGHMVFVLDVLLFGSMIQTAIDAGLFPSSNGVSKLNPAPTR
jgi:purine-binding chemotaxis protein CheW